MCLLDSCCCCFSLTVGTHLICLGYMGFFSYFALLRNMYYHQELMNILQWYIYGGLCSSICGWIGLRWEKKFFVSIMFLYDLCVAVVRSGMIYSYYNFPYYDNLIDRENIAQQQVMFLMFQLYFLWVQFSYLKKDKPLTNIFHPVPQNVIITEVRRENLSAPIATAFPIEYQPQLPYSAQPFPVPINIHSPAPSAVPQYPAYSSNYTHLYSNSAYPNVENHTMNAHINTQPFPYDAPPPYSETKAAPSAPSL